ncbi:metallophosphoesterase domain-containingprotein [Purpureocillium lilacinum]|nr:metallophosphoesterase domain-containingprotein [Purpureocillium lilacinum]OAQ87044.1 metallophosphoesterase domain-containingprotein [Purpureocillium lilacinum]OAQ95001.1 metallophosphoesterase domain-containingprotein [Purpureocillium lilacinum]GJN66748.1 hypothetical protein PLICBS_000768 [Purpureocillium lilacinum]
MGVLTWLGLRRSECFDSPTLLDHLLTSPLAYLVSRFYHLALFLRGTPFYPPRSRPPIRVVCISDTHDQVVSVPAGDILIHAGDLTNDGSASAIQKQLDWLKAQPHRVKVVIAGNHDSFFDPEARSDEDVRAGAALNLDGLVYLQGELTVQEIKGRSISIFGAPDIIECGPKNFAFQYKPESHPWLSKVPLQTDILVTHGPPKYHRDLDLGCPHLLREVWRVRPRLHVFGHIHCAYGKEAAYFDDVQLAYEHFLARPRRGLLGDLIPSGTWVDAAKVVFHGIHSVLWKWLMGGPRSNQGSLMVNAAQMYKNSGRARSRAIVVDI